MYQSPDPSLWQGRIDSDESGDARRWHQVMQLQSPAQPGVALIGFACDAGVRRNQGRVGASAGPTAARRALANLAWHHRGAVFDAGDVLCVDDALELAQAELATLVGTQLMHGHLPLVIGGGHEIAWGNWRALAAHAVNVASAGNTTPPRIGVINFDAHFDLRHSVLGNSGTPFKQISDDCRARGWDFNYAVLGIAEPANTAALFARAAELGVWHVLDQNCVLPNVQPQLQAWCASLDWIYLTICLDVFPASVAPGVSAPAAAGVALGFVETLLAQIQATGKLRLADVAELNPQFDVDHRTAKLAARLLWQLAKTDFGQ
jgi:formiminoglutamase